MQQQGFQENYDIEQLQDMLQQLKQSNNHQKHLALSQQQIQVINDYIKDKRKRVFSREGVINQYFGIQSYVDLQVSKQDDYQNSSGLMERCVNYI